MPSKPQVEVHSVQADGASTERGAAMDQELYGVLRVSAAAEHLQGVGGEGEGGEGV